jgi:hypothetical protein
VKRQDDAPRARKIIDKIGVIERERRSLGNGVSAKVPRFSCNNIRAINVVISIAVAINHGAGAALRTIDRDGAGVIDQILSLTDYIVERTRLVDRKLFNFKRFVTPILYWCIRTPD